MSEYTSKQEVEEFRAIDRLLDQLRENGLDERLPPTLVQKIFTIAVKNYARCYEQDPSVTPLLPDRVNATEVANSCLEMLRVVNLELFELTFWGGRLADDHEDR